MVHERLWKKVKVLLIFKIKESLTQVNPEKRIVIWLRNYFDELGVETEKMDDLLKIYITSIKLMLPMAFMNLMLLGIVVGQNAPANAVNLKKHSAFE